MKGGRPAVFLGCRKQDRRIRYFDSSGRTRGFYARWRPNLKKWECQLSGYGLKSRRWFELSQTMALHRLRMTRCLDPFIWRKVVIDKSVLWEGVPDLGYTADGLTEAQAFPEWNSVNNPVVSHRGAGDASPAVTQPEMTFVDHDGLEVGELPADQLELYFPGHVLKGPRAQAVSP